MDSQESLKVDMYLAWISDLQNNLYVLEVKTVETQHRIL